MGPRVVHQQRRAARADDCRHLRKIRFAASSSRSCARGSRDRVIRSFPRTVPTALAATCVVSSSASITARRSRRARRRRRPPPRPPDFKPRIGVVGSAGHGGPVRRLRTALGTQYPQSCPRSARAPATGARSRVTPLGRQQMPLPFSLKRHVVHEVTMTNNPRPYSRSEIVGMRRIGKRLESKPCRRRSRGCAKRDPAHVTRTYDRDLPLPLANRRSEGFGHGRWEIEVIRRADSVPGEMRATNSRRRPPSRESSGRRVLESGVTSRRRFKRGERSFGGRVIANSVSSLVTRTASGDPR